MNVKPLYDTETIVITRNRKPSSLVTMTKLNTAKVKDSNSIIPNGIYKVIYWEKLRQLITLAFSIVILLLSIGLNYYYYWNYETSFMAYFFPSFIGLIATYKALISFFEFRSMKVSVKRYEEDIKIGLGGVPVFISKLYITLHRKQITHNWMTTFVIFYGGIITLLLWWLKDFSWWIFEVDKWILNWFADPTLMTYVFTSILVGVATLQVVMTIQRKKRILDIDAYFGEKFVTAAQLEEIKIQNNKFYRRLFILSIMIILLIPFIVKAFLRLRKKNN